jgi:hypothetical protein
MSKSISQKFSNFYSHLFIMIELVPIFIDIVRF